MTSFFGANGVDIYNFFQYTKLIHKYQSLNIVYQKNEKSGNYFLVSLFIFLINIGPDS